MKKLEAVKDNIRNYKWLIPRLWLLFGFLWNVWYQIMYGQKLLDSDMASEMVLSDILNREHSISGLTTSWRYSSELRVLNMQWLFRIGLAFFRDNWHLARVLSMTLAILLLAFSVWFVLYSINLSELGIWAAALALFPGGAYYFWLATFGGYYLPYIYIALFSFSLTVLAIRDVRSVRSIVYIVLVILLGIGSGLNGIKQLMMYYAPLILSSICMIIIEYRNEKSENKRKTVNFFIISVLSGLASMIGYLINSKVLSNIYVFKRFDETKIKSKSFFQMMKEYIWSFGYAEDKILLSPAGIASMFGVFFWIIVIVCGILMIYKFEKLSFEIKLLSSFCFISIVFCVFIFSYIKIGNIEYYEPLVPLGYYLVVLEIYTAEYKYPKSRFVLYNLAMVLLLAASLGTAYNEDHEPWHSYRAQPELNSLVTWLKGGYTEGVSAFWTANIVTELSDGTIDMWTLESDSLNWHNWLQREDHFGSFPRGKYFYLVDNAELDEDVTDDYYINQAIVEAFLAEHPELIKIHQDENYTVWGVIE